MLDVFRARFQRSTLPLVVYFVVPPSEITRLRQDRISRQLAQFAVNRLSMPNSRVNP
jgi:hypothetical protein